MLWLHQKLKQKGSQLRGQRIACDCLQPLFLTMVSCCWFEFFEPLSTSLPPCGKSQDLPQISTLVIHETRDTNTFCKLWAARCQRSHHEPCILYFQCAIKRILAFSPHSEACKRSSFRRPNCLTWTIQLEMSGRGTLSAAGSWDGGDLCSRQCPGSPLTGNSYFAELLASPVCSSGKVRRRIQRIPWPQ